MKMHENKNKPGILIKVLNVVGIVIMAFGIIGAIAVVSDGDISTAIIGGVTFLIIGALLFSIGKWGRIKAKISNADRRAVSERSALYEELPLIIKPEKLDKEIIRKQEQLKALKSEINKKEKEIQSKEDELQLFNAEITLMDFCVYEPKYNCTSSEEYKERIKECRDYQKSLVRDKVACSCSENWTVDGSLSKGRAMTNDNIKMALLAFNGSCDSLISKAKFNNIERIELQIANSYERINRLNERNKVRITTNYLKSKLEELHLCYEYELKKQEEKEEIRRIREAEREEQKLKKEIEAARKKIAKEETHYNNALENIELQLQTADEKDKPALLDKKREIEEKLEEIDKSIKDIDYREANQKAGYVYVISNIGSFGENIYKIGMTRRLDPQDRVDELGDASVPFRFDIHAMIFSEDAPALEAALHNAFEDKKVNLVNNRKEFFNVTLDEIEKVVKENYDKTVDFVKLPEAEQYRESMMIRKHK